uniref:Putative sorbin and sh3 domain-containing protein n=1 Tax=Nyssomyia neivai TaxID=330878 RepID=A0A1L8DM84_9DIPT
MTIPSRPAPAPPQQRSSGASQLRYTPTTDWDDSPFDMAAGVSQGGSGDFGRKVPPPRPPPPKGAKPPLKKSGQPQSVNILSNLFGVTGRRAKTPPTKATVGPHIGALKLPPPKIHPPQATTRYQSAAPSDVQLIDFNSPPSSPTFTQKSNSDCVSVDSFSSDSNYSPNNGHSSQAESGFEDDFASADILQSNRDAWRDAVDPFTSPPVCQNYVGPKIRPPVAQKPIVLAGASSFYGVNSSTSHVKQITAKFDDPLCNGKTLVAPTPTVTAPTIIKPTIAPKPSGLVRTKGKDVFQGQGSLEDPCPSPPMPTCPPPPPPPSFYLDDIDEMESYGVALYNFETEEVGDLNFRENEKIYLLRQIDAEWMYGRNKRGCEGMFPVNFIEIRVPLKEQKSQTHHTNGPTTKGSPPTRKARILYDFTAEMPEDLTLREGEFVNVLQEINTEWLYGEFRGRKGQFPANFVEFI